MPDHAVQLHELDSSYRIIKKREDAVIKKLLLPVVFLLLQGCMSIDYVPEEYAIEDGRIGQLTVTGTVQINNLQSDETKVFFFDGPSKWHGNYKKVTEHLRWQLEKELKKNALQQAGGANKTIGVKITNLKSVQHTFHFTSIMHYTITLGNGETIEKRVQQGSPGNMWRVLNGTIALGVIDTLNDDKVRKYLAE